MSTSISYKILPLSFIAFSKIYTSDLNTYKKYLDLNTSNHHYNGMTLASWFEQEKSINKRI